MSKPFVRLFDWEVEDSIYNDSQNLAGRVIGHPRFKDGDRIHSSPILKRGRTFSDGEVLNEDPEGDFAETHNTVYHLQKFSQEISLLLGIIRKLEKRIEELEDEL